MRTSRKTTLLILAICILTFKAEAQKTGKNPVIIIPGISGSTLVNPTTGRTVWFSVKRDKYDDLRLPMTSSLIERNRDSLIPIDIIREVELPVLPDVDVYKTLIEALKARGYTEASWANPQAADVFYVFAYDWRRDNVESARLLMQRMSAVKRTLKRPELKFDLLAHSMGGLIARYAAMYGTADLSRRRNPVPNWAGTAHIRKLMMFGTPNEGSFAAFDALLNGYPILADRKLPLVDDLRAEDVMTIPSVFQLLPSQNSARFFDEKLRPLKVDIYDIKTWIKYGWGSLADPKFLSKLKDARRLAIQNKEIKPVRPDKDASVDDRLLSRTTFGQVRAYFSAALERAERFHAALDAQTTDSPIQIYAYGGNCSETLDGAIILHDKDKDRWITLLDDEDIKTADGEKVSKDAVKGILFAPGDGRVTTRSLLGEMSTLGKAATRVGITLESSLFTCGSHFTLFLEKPILDSFLSALIVEKVKQP